MIIKTAALLAGFCLLSMLNLQELLKIKNKKEKKRALLTFALLIVTGLGLSLFQVLGIKIISPPAVFDRLVKLVLGI